VDCNLNEEQRRILDDVRTVVRTCGSPLSGTADEGLLSILRRELDNDGTDGAVLKAALIVEEVSRLNHITPAVYRLLLASLLPESLSGVIALQREGARNPVRFGAQASALVVVGSAGGAEVYRVSPDGGAIVDTGYEYPLGYPGARLGPSLCSLPAAAALRRWQLVIAAEITGAMDAAIGQLVEYLTHRKQFGRSLGAFQAIQHRLAELAASVECARILTREAAWRDGDELAAGAACYAASAARQVCLECHQLSGARGFTLEFGLYKATLRLQALSLEAGGATGHAVDAAGYRWPVSECAPSGFGRGPAAIAAVHSELSAEEGRI
jgi:hypothetical protein